MVGEVYYNSEEEYTRPVYQECLLARAVIEQALLDADDPNPSFNRLEARKFLCAYRKSWSDSLYAWLEVAGLSERAAFFIRLSREKWGKELGITLQNKK